MDNTPLHILAGATWTIDPCEQGLHIHWVSLMFDLFRAGEGTRKMEGERKGSAGYKGGKGHLTLNTSLGLGIWLRNQVILCFIATSLCSCSQH